MIALAFNGGKESLIVLHQNINNKIIVFTVEDPNDFTEISSYVNYIEKLYNISIIRYTDLKYAISDLKIRYCCDTIIMGNRSTDPGCENLEIYSQTDDSYPKIIRHNPLIKWTYSDVWNYIDENKLPVCSLYERGYTSIGNKLNTYPNYLLFTGCSYSHAKYLEDHNSERIGRIPINLPLEFSGIVIRGLGMGKKLGFPTANIQTNFNICDGIYYGVVFFNETIQKMVMSVGPNIHFDAIRSTIEIHIIGQKMVDFYDQILKIKVLGFIRKMKKYVSEEKLIEAIKNDIDIAIFSMINN